MNIEEVREYALSMPGATEDQAYGPDWVLFRIEGNETVTNCNCLNLKVADGKMRITDVRFNLHK